MSKISQYPQTTTLNGQELVLVDVGTPGSQTTKTITTANLGANLLQNVSPITIPIPTSGNGITITGNSTTNTAGMLLQNLTTGDGLGAYAITDWFNALHALYVGISSSGHVGNWAGIANGPAGESGQIGTNAAIPLALAANSINIILLQAPSGLGSQSISGYGPQAAAFVDMTPDTGSFTITYTGFTTTVQGTAIWTRMGNLVALYLPSLTGTSNATTFTATGLPNAIQPVRQQNLLITNAEDNGVFSIAQAQVANSGNQLRFFFGAGAAPWTASGTKGINGAATIVYPLN